MVHIEISERSTTRTIESRKRDSMSFENANPNGAQQQMEGISDLPAADGLAMLAAVTPAPKQREEEAKVKSAARDKKAEKKLFSVQLAPTL